MILKIMASDGSQSAARAYEAYDYANKMGAHIVCNSFGNPYPAGVPQEPAPSYHEQWQRQYKCAAWLLPVAADFWLLT